MPFNAHLVMVRVPVLVLSVSNKSLLDPYIRLIRRTINSGEKKDFECTFMVRKIPYINRKTVVRQFCGIMVSSPFAPRATLLTFERLDLLTVTYIAR